MTQIPFPGGESVAGGGEYCFMPRSLITCHAPAAAIRSPQRWGGTRICRGRVLGLTFSLSTAEGQAGEDRGLLLLGSRCGQRGQ